jgi:serpin B
LAQAHGKLGFNLMNQLIQTKPGQNVFISPTSISIALSMAYAGSGGPTQQEMAQVLGYGGYSPAQVDAANKQIQFATQDPSVTLQMANSIWLNQSFTLKDGYQKEMADYYGARAQTLDFTLEQSSQTINRWVSDQTRGKIPTIVSADTIRAAKAVLINAVYFKGNWTYPFDPQFTSPRPFHPQNRAVMMVDMMKKSGSYQYIADDQLQVIRLPYGDQNLSMYVALPAASSDSSDNIEVFVQNLNQNQWRERLNQMYSQKGTILLPKFKIEYATQLVPSLSAMGMHQAFTDGADFSGISSTPLKIDQVIHKTFVQVDEKGTEAAAVTAVVMTVGAAAPGSEPPPFYMEVNRPFFFTIQDDRSGEILFMGTVNAPPN